MLNLDLLAAAITILALEILLRLTFRHASGDSPDGFRKGMLDISHRLKLFSGIESHPFLQFTRPRTQLSKGDQEYGFRGIKLSDVPKPAGVARIACIGGRGTEGGYPEFLQAYLDAASRASRFQVLDFGIDGWTSVHSMLNFILNVREFHPDIVVIHDELRGGVCSGYPCPCRDRIHDYTPQPFRDNPLDEWMLRIWWIYRAGKVLLARSRDDAFDRDRRELQQYQRNIETICTLAASDGIKVFLLTMPCATDDGSHSDPTRAVNEVLREIANQRKIALVELENLSDADKTDNRMKAERVGKMIVALGSGAHGQ